MQLLLATAEKYTTNTGTLKIINRQMSKINDNIIQGTILFKPKKSQTNPNPQWTNYETYNNIHSK